MNHFAKVGDACLRLWGKILRSLPHAKLILILKGAEQDIVKKSLLIRCKKAQLNPKQLIIQNRLSEKDYFDLYRQVDLVLDPFPFNGGTTNVDCLCMHKPFNFVETFHSRLGYNLLKQLQLEELIANTKKST